MKQPNIFVSHQWKYDQGYHSLKIKFRDLGWPHLDYSVPEHDPFDLARKRQIEAALREQVRQCNFFIVFARMSAGNSYWIEKEIHFAQEYNKFILGVRPWGYTGNVPIFIQDACDQIVGFNAPSIIKIIEDVLS